MNKSLNIAIFTDNFLPGVGGTENAVLCLASALSVMGHNVVVICPNYKKSMQNDAKFGFKIFRLKSIKIDKNNYYALPFLTKKLTKFLDELHPDIIHCHTEASLLSIAQKYAKKRNIPLAVTMHTKYSYCFKQYVKSKTINNILLKKIGKKLKKVTRVIAVSKSMQEEFEKYGYSKKFDVVKNGLSLEKCKITEEFSNLALKKYSLSKSDNILLFVGHISEMKNLTFIFETLKLLKSDYKMIFVGSGEGNNYYKNMCKNLALEDKVIFTGNISDKTLLSSLYYNAKLYVFPSIFDNDSLSIIESASYETPSITLEGTGSSERITDGQNGFIVKNDPKIMAEKIDYLLSHQNILHQVGINASLQIVKSWEQTAEEYLEIYLDTIKKYNSKA